MNYIIECKNKDNVNIANPPGVYNTLIQDKVMLETGDSIVMKSVFIDREAQSQQKVIIGEPMTCTISHINYIMNSFGIPHMESDSFKDFGASTRDTVINDNQLYLLCKKTAANPNFRHLNKLNFEAHQVEGAPSGNFMTFVKYTDLNGDAQTTQIQIPGFGSDPYNIDVTFNILYDSSQDITIHCGTADGFRLAYTNMPLTAQPVYQNTVISGLDNSDEIFPSSFSTVVGSNTYEAVKSTHTFNIPKANYDPNDLCELINRQLGQSGANISATNLTDNDLLKTVTPTDPFYFVNGRGGTDNINNDYRYQYSIANDPSVPGSTNIQGIYCGASYVTLAFEPATQKFFWEYLHTPYYKANAESVGYGTFTANDGSTFLGAIDRHSGILLTDVTSINSETKRTTDFWSGILGFQIDRQKDDCLLVSYASEANFENPPPALYSTREQVHKPTFVNNEEPQIGVNMTSNFQGLPTAVSTQSITIATSGKPTSGFPYVPVLGAAGNPTNQFLSTSAKTSGVEATDGVLAGQVKQNFGYYLIEVEAQFQNNYITADQNRRSVMGIVSRYYAKDSYTSASEDASVIYTHQGEPQILSSFNIRILDSDKQVAQNIGTDNTVHLMVVKSPKKLNTKK